MLCHIREELCYTVVITKLGMKLQTVVAVGGAGAAGLGSGGAPCRRRNVDMFDGSQSCGGDGHDN
jgi:predicted NAD/FAD-binding protein